MSLLTIASKYPDTEHYIPWVRYWLWFSIHSSTALVFLCMETLNCRIYLEMLFRFVFTWMSLKELSVVFGDKTWCRLSSLWFSLRFPFWMVDMLSCWFCVSWLGRKNLVSDLFSFLMTDSFLLAAETAWNKIKSDKDYDLF